MPEIFFYKTLFNKKRKIDFYTHCPLKDTGKNSPSGYAVTHRRTGYWQKKKKPCRPAPSYYQHDPVFFLESRTDRMIINTKGWDLCH